MPTKVRSKKTFVRNVDCTALPTHLILWLWCLFVCFEFALIQLPDDEQLPDVRVTSPADGLGF